VDKAVNLFWNLLIPSFAAGVFSVVGDLMQHGAAAAIQPGDYDISFGCVFSIVGVASTQNEPRRWKVVYGLFVLALLLSIVFDIVLRYHITGTEVQMIVTSNVISFLLAGYAMWNYGG
jgi:hypothetical protein